MEMRKVLAQTLDDLMEKNENIVLIDADLSKPNGLSGLKDKYPKRAMDVGIAEQNMACIAAGMSSYGFVPFISTFTAFASRRICDQIAISCAYAKQNVKIIATDPGISAEYNGGTHMSFEDVGVFRSIPEIVIVEPTDCTQLKKLLPQIANHYGVVYIRTLRKEVTDVFSENDNFDLFKSMIETSNIIKMFDGEKEFISSSIFVGTGKEIRIYNNETLINTYKLSISGDVNGDGKILANDILIQKLHILNKSLLMDEYLMAGDINNDGKVNALDILYLKRYILGKTENVWDKK